MNHKPVNGSPDTLLFSNVSQRNSELATLMQSIADRLTAGEGRHCSRGVGGYLIEGTPYCASPLSVGLDTTPEIRSPATRHKMHRSPQLQGIQTTHNAPRVSYCAYRFAATGDAAQKARETGRDPLTCYLPLLRAITPAAAFFSLTPEVMGTKDWSKTVVSFLKTRERTPTAKADGLRPKKSQGNAANQVN